MEPNTQSAEKQRDSQYSAVVPVDNNETKSVAGDSATAAIDSTSDHGASSSSKPPYHPFSSRQRSFILGIVALLSLIGPLSTTIYIPALLVIRDEMNTTIDFINLTISLFLLAMGVVPLFWAMIADNYGRNIVYVSSLLIFTLSNIALALSKSISFLAGFRLVQGVGVSAVMAIGAGSIADVYEPHERGTALGLYFIGPLIGPILGPIIGGYITKYAGWRTIFWVLTGIGGALLAMCIAFLPETHRYKVAVKYGLPLPPASAMKKTMNPLQPLKYAIYPLVLLPSVFMMLVFGDLQVWSSTVTPIFTALYHLKPDIIGWTYMASAVGNIIGSIIGGRLADYGYNKAKSAALQAAKDRILSENSGLSEEEALEEAKQEIDSTVGVGAEGRLLPAWICAVLYPASYIAYGWIVHSGGPLWATLIMEFLFGIGMTTGFASVSTYVLDIYPARSASINSIGNAFRFVWSAIAVQIVPQIQKRMSIGAMFTLFGGLTLIGLPTLFVLTRYGVAIRQRYPPK
ncbi:MFS general substrate transporter [Ramicandelaber brevisporus]|nr:MFS general substrate transporter [Ramicandelaber brevisporus]